MFGTVLHRIFGILLVFSMNNWPEFSSVVIWTALPIGEYAAVTLLLFFGLKSIKDAWDLPSNVAKNGDKSSPELDEYVEAEELVKEKVSYNLKDLSV